MWLPLMTVFMTFLSAPGGSLNPLPALHEQRDDIALLVEALLGHVALQRHLQINETALRLPNEPDYPGNVRELRN